MSRNNLASNHREWKAQGWDIRKTNGGHIALTHPEVSGTVFAGSTVSDFRAVKNVEARLRRSLVTGTVAVGADQPASAAQEQLPEQGPQDALRIPRKPKARATEASGQFEMPGFRPDHLRDPSLPPPRRRVFLSDSDLGNRREECMAFALYLLISRDKAEDWAVIGRSRMRFKTDATYRQLLIDRMHHTAPNTIRLLRLRNRHRFTLALDNQQTDNNVVPVMSSARARAEALFKLPVVLPPIITGPTILATAPVVPRPAVPSKPHPKVASSPGDRTQPVARKIDVAAVLADAMRKHVLVEEQESIEAERLAAARAQTALEQAAHEQARRQELLRRETRRAEREDADRAVDELVAARSRVLEEEERVAAEQAEALRVKRAEMKRIAAERAEAQRVRRAETERVAAERAEAAHQVAHQAARQVELETAARLAVKRTGFMRDLRRWIGAATTCRLTAISAASTGLPPTAPTYVAFPTMADDATLRLVRAIIAQPTPVPAPAAPRRVVRAIIAQPTPVPAPAPAPPPTPRLAPPPPPPTVPAVHVVPLPEIAAQKQLVIPEGFKITVLPEHGGRRKLPRVVPVKSADTTAAKPEGPALRSVGKRAGHPGHGTSKAAQASEAAVQRARKLASSPRVAKQTAVCGTDATTEPGRRMGRPPGTGKNQIARARALAELTLAVGTAIAAE